jgi:hypothetical protein
LGLFEVGAGALRMSRLACQLERPVQPLRCGIEGGEVLGLIPQAASPKDIGQLAQARKFLWAPAVVDNPQALGQRVKRADVVQGGACGCHYRIDREQ